MDPATFIKPDLVAEVHVTIEYCNRWLATSAASLSVES